MNARVPCLGAFLPVRCCRRRISYNYYAILSAQDFLFLYLHMHKMNSVMSLEFCLFFPRRVLKLKVLPLLNESRLPVAENGAELNVYTEQIAWQHNTTTRWYRPSVWRWLSSYAFRSFIGYESYCLKLEVTWNNLKYLRTGKHFVLCSFVRRICTRKLSYGEFLSVYRTYVYLSAHCSVLETHSTQHRYSVTADVVCKIAEYSNKIANVDQRILSYGSVTLTAEMC